MDEALAFIANNKARLLLGKASDSFHMGFQASANLSSIPCYTILTPLWRRNVKVIAVGPVEEMMLGGGDCIVDWRASVLNGEATNDWDPLECIHPLGPNVRGAKAGIEKIYVVLGAKKDFPIKPRKAAITWPLDQGR